MSEKISMVLVPDLSFTAQSPIPSEFHDFVVDFTILVLYDVKDVEKAVSDCTKGIEWILVVNCNKGVAKEVNVSGKFEDSI
ncbi:3277_t:CDS:2 [Diversispora eburnea]|uniref:3277_t:CDS:1 n=1 Tax=Diversispora eburnea TaxID=1213867 RepID=A0A9N8W706_9GLOM|nr:3277_t:CDS:2 [Diversispora eburnea]